jgi:hypothetical protein
MTPSPESRRCAPIALFTFCRLEHTQRTIEALMRNALAAQSDLVIYSDGARCAQQQEDVDAVRRYLAGVTGFRSVFVRCRETNLGLARSIIQGVSEMLEGNGRVIILEDDMITSPHFLSYMNEGLDLYADDDRVCSIHGYVYPVQRTLPEAFLLAGADCWGWATWRRGWQVFNADGRALLAELEHRRLERAFDFNGSYPYTRMLRQQIEGANDSWAIRWYASAFLAGKMTLYPGRSLVQNIGNDSSGTHCGSTDVHDVHLAQTPIKLALRDENANEHCRAAFEEYFRQTRGWGAQRWWGWARQWLGVQR